MWSRSELKASAKVALKPNYWKAVVVSLIMLVITGGSGSSSSNATKNLDTSSIDPELLFGMLTAILATLAVVMVVSVILSIFVFNPMQVGAQRFFVKCYDEQPEIGEVLFAFKNSFMNVVKTLFFRDIFVFLWSLLFIIPGIIKGYEYRMIPFILAENPEMDRNEAFARSKEMMTGNKWNAFVLDLSFLGWILLGVCTCGILLIFYVNPYCYLTNAQLYRTLKQQNNVISSDM